MFDKLELESSRNGKRWDKNYSSELSVRVAFGLYVVNVEDRFGRCNGE